MNVLIISGMYPTKKYSFGGVFVGERYKKLSTMCNVDLYRVGNKYSKIYKIIYEDIFKKGIMEEFNDNSIDDVNWKNINLRLSLTSIILKRINSKLFYEYNIDFIGRKLDIKKYDIIHAHWAYPTGYIAMLLSRKYNIPYIVTAHGSDIHTIPKSNIKIAKATVEVLENAEKVIFVSAALKEEAKNLGYSGTNSSVIYNGVDVDRFKMIKDDNYIKLIKENKEIIGYIGRLDEIKGADRIPQIFNFINTAKKNIEFLLIGTGELEDNIINSLNELGINYRHFKDISHETLYKYINQCDVIIVPSKNESFCCVALECQACGIKVVASKVGGIPECVGKFGFLVDEGANFEERFARKVIEALNTSINIEDMIKRTKDFSWGNIVKKEYNLYDEIINKRGRNER